MKEGRIAYIDLAKGFCISLVMLFHLKEALGREYWLDGLLFSSCMLPPFFFVSGIFFRGDTDFRTFLRGKVRHLLLPFAVFYLLTSVLLPAVLSRFLGMQFATVTGWSSLWAFIWPGEFPNIPLWFLWCLFLVCLMFRVAWDLSCRFFPSHRQTAAGLMSVACSLVGFYAERRLGFDVGSLFEAMQSLPFYCAGYLWVRTSSRQTGSSRGINLSACSFVYFIVFLALASLPCLLQVHLLSVPLSCAFFLLCGLAGSALVLLVAFVLKRLPLISLLGRYSLLILVTHELLIRILSPLLMRLSQYAGPDVAIVLVWLLLALCYVLGVRGVKTAKAASVS